LNEFLGGILKSLTSIIQLCLYDYTEAQKQWSKNIRRDFLNSVLAPFKPIIQEDNQQFNQINNLFNDCFRHLVNVTNMKDSIAFGERLKQSLSKAGHELRPAVLEREFNQRYWGTPVSVQAVRKWLLGQVIPTQDKLQVLAEWLQIDPHWLRFGEERFGSVREQEAKWEIGMTQEDRDMISRFLELSLAERETIRRYNTSFFRYLSRY
jgi:transcriptional regulator with XRE-family HTH domain